MAEIALKPLRYLPFLHGRHTTSPSLKPVRYRACDPASYVFQIDTDYHKTIANKYRLREQGIDDYYHECRLSEETAAAVCRFMIDRTLLESSNYFRKTGSDCRFVLRNHIKNESVEYDDRYRYLGSEYRSLFDALCMQYQEDMAVVQLRAEKDWLAALHVFAPNFWKPVDKIGKDFSAVHEPVPDMEKVKRHFRPLLQHIIEREGIYERFGWGITADDRLDHLGDRSADDDHAEGPRKLGHGSADQPFIRIERQVLIGLRNVRALLFTIRTYFQPVDMLTVAEATALKTAVQSMSDNMRKYKDIGNKLDKFLKKLS